MRADLHYAIRTLLKHPGYALLVLLTVALGIGVMASIGSIVNAYYIRPLPFPDADRLVSISDVQPHDEHTVASNPEFEDYRNATNLFAAATAEFRPSMNLTERQRPLRLSVALVARDYFEVFGVRPLLGRVFTMEEHRAGAAPVIVLSERIWRTEFGSDPRIIGTALTLDGLRYTVVGICDSSAFLFTALDALDAWVPLERNPPYSGRGVHFLTVVAKLKPGISLQQARSGAAVLAKQLDAKYKTRHGIYVAALRDQLFGSARASLFLLLAAAGFLLVISTANVANLLLARVTARGREFAIRLAIGAGRWQLIRQTLAESICIVIAGSSLGFLFSLWAAGTLQRLWPTNIRHPQNFSPDWRVFLFLTGLAAVTACLCGIGPAFGISIGSVSERLREGWGQVARARGRGVLVATEMAVACTLLSGAALLLTSFWHVLNTDSGFNPENVLAMRIALPRAKYKEDWQRVAFFDQIISRLRTLPGTTAVGIANNVPLDGGDITGDFKIEGRPPFPAGEAPLTRKNSVTGDYFRAMGIRLLRGRWFNDVDGTKGHQAVIINDTMAKEFWPHEDPVGKHIDMQIGEPGPQEIVGVVSDVRGSSLDKPARYEGYLPYRQLAGGFMTIVIRTTADSSRIASATRNSILAIDPEQPVSNVRTMEQMVSASVAPRRLTAIIVAAFAVFALLLATVGIYGVISYWVSQRTREIGIRSALGAQRLNIFELVIGRGMLLAGVGAASGVVASWWLTRYMASLLFGVSPHDWLAMSAAPLTLGLVAFVACCVPAVRAARVDPLVALRME